MDSEMYNKAVELKNRMRKSDDILNKLHGGIVQLVCLDDSHYPWFYEMSDSVKSKVINIIEEENKDLKLEFEKL